MKKNNDIRDANAEPPPIATEPNVQTEVQPDVQTDVQKEAKAPAELIELQRGQLAPTDHRQLKTTVSIIAQGGGFPKRFDTLPKQIAAYNLARALMGDKWQMALNNMADVHGQMMIYGEMPRSLAERTKEVKEFKVYVVDKELKEICLVNKNIDEQPYSGVCDVQRIGREKKQYVYTIKDAEKAGQFPPMKWTYKDNKRDKQIINEDSPWIKYTKIMLMRKAQAIAVKFEFPDALAGAPIAEYETEELPDYVPVKDVTESVDKAKLINEKFSRPREVVAPAGAGEEL